MRSRLNLAMVVAAGALALVLTVVRQSPDGVVFDPEIPIARAAPGTARSQHYDLAALKIFNMTLLRIKDRYVDPARVDPKKMLYAALDHVQLNIPEVLVEPDLQRNKLKVTVNDKPKTFDTEDVDSPWRLAGKLKKVFKFIEANMNPGSDLAKVEYAAVNGMLSTLDPHSVLMDPEQARDMDVSTSGKFGGLGIVIRMIDRKLMVVKPMKDTPAWRKGIKAGDHIVKINNEPTENLTSNEAVDRMRGDPKTGVTLWIERKGESKLLRFDIIRDIIHVSQVDHKLLDASNGKKVGYIRVRQFSKGIARDVGDAMKEMSGRGATSWILDLRGNPGGLLEEAVQLSDLFVDTGTVVTTVSKRDREARRADRGFGDTTSSLALLVNGNSASASEIVAGALKNLDRAIVIGTRTFGKGTVQELYDNDDKSKLKLTIAQYLTPGDRSIQNLGIVPDVQLQRMYVPDKNDSPDDFVRLLPPSRTYGEKDLDAALVSSYAKDTDKPAYKLPFLVERKKTANGEQSAVEDDDDDEDLDDDTITEDFEMRFARDLVASVRSSRRPTLIAGAKRLVQRVRSSEETKLIAALSKISIDWAAAPAKATAASLEATLTSTASNGNVNAGDTLTLTATVKNTGTVPAYRVLSRLHTDDNVFDDTELPIGKIAPGETKSFVTRIKVPTDALDRVDHVGLEIREAHKAPARVTPIELRVHAAPRPVFAYAYQLIDNGNGDGLVQRGERYQLAVRIKNTGDGPTQKATVLLRNATGDGVILTKSRLELTQPLAPGQVRDIVFPLSTTRALSGNKLIVELMAYDAALDVQSREKLTFKVRQPVSAGKMAEAYVTVKTPTTVHSGAADDTTIIGAIGRGASFAAIASYGPYTKVKLDRSRVGFLATSALKAGGGGNSRYVSVWNSTPPRIALDQHDLDTNASSYKLNGRVSDEDKVEDVYIFVSNQNAKIDSRKVFYRSNRGAQNSRQMAFSADLPLWPGSNMVTVVARSNTEVRTIKTMYVYRQPPRTAQAPR